VLREIKHVEGMFLELRKKGAPPEGPAYTDADAASQAFQAMAPVGVKLFKLEKMVLQA
jgi:type 2A phosphatase activator TIP41